MPEDEPKVAQATQTTQTEPPARSPEPSMSEDNRLVAALGYAIPIIVPLYVLLTDLKKKKDMKFHAMQSLLFSGAYIVLSILLSIISIPLMFIGVGICIYPIMLLPYLYILFVAYKVYTGERYVIPEIGKHAEEMASK